jgi:uncharacterized protein involved in exopolysaccharide biosynthesis
LLAKQYEAARLDEAKDSAIIQVLDSAIEPERKSRPSRASILLITALLSFLIGIACAVVKEGHNAMSREDAEKWAKLMTSFKRRS